MYYYTEGIGGSAGIISKLIPQFEYYDELVCSGNYNNPENNCTSVASINNMVINEINIYPNPATKTIYLDLGTEINFVISSLEGKTILDGTTSNTIDIGHLTTGIYFLNLKNNNGSITKKVIVKSGIGGKRVVSMLIGEQLPRIC